MGRRALPHEVRQPRAPGNDGPGRTQSVAARANERLRRADRGHAPLRIFPGRVVTSASPLPLFPVSTVGSWPRPPELVRALGARRRRTITPAQFDEIADRAVSSSVEAQERAGVDLITDGEQ